MFDIGFWELLIIGMVALLVVGPDRLPGMATFIGHWVGRARRFTNHMRREIQEEFEAEQLKNLVNEQQRELDSLRQEVEEVRDETETSARDIERGVRDSTDAAKADTGTQSAADSSSTVTTKGEPGGTERAGHDSPTEPSAENGDNGHAARKKTAAKKKSAKKAASKKKGSARKKSAAKKKTVAQSRPAGANPSSEERAESSDAADSSDAER